MSEKAPQNQEASAEKNKPLEQRGESLKNQNEKELTKAEREHGSDEQLESILKSVEQKAVSGKEMSRGDKETPHNHPVLINKQLKDMAFSRALTRARKKLSLPSKAFSKVIHNEVVDKTSEVLGKTVARPAGLLWGSVLAFIGTTALLWITRHYGYEYNYLMLIILFVGGLIIGNVAELLWRMLRKNR